MASFQDLDTRQRMINLLYLIFMAMLAMSMSKKVLRSFGMINQSLKHNNQQVDERNQNTMSTLATKAQNKPAKYSERRQRALKVMAAGNDLYSYVGEIKDDLFKTVDKNENGRYEYASMDRSVVLDNMFFANDKKSKRAKKLIKKMHHFRDVVLANTDRKSLSEAVKEKFNTPVVKLPEGKRPWLRDNFEGFPMIASIAHFTEIQSNVKSVQHQFLSNLITTQLENTASLTNYNAIVIAKKAAFFNGENFQAKVVLGRYDKTMTIKKAVINGEKVTNTKAGQVFLDFPAGNIGSHKIKGKIIFAQGDSTVSIPVDYEYRVIPMPHNAVISADKMNVLYRGVKNPMTIAMPGISNISAHADGLHKVSGTGNYVAVVTNVQGYKVKIYVSGKLPTGKVVTDSKVFRIKDIPRPVATIRGQAAGGSRIRIQRRGLKISTIGAKIPDFDFKVNVVVTGFKFQVPGQPIIQVHGTRLNARAKRALKDADRGSLIQIFDIQAHLEGAPGYHLPDVSPLTVQLTN